MSRRWEEKNTRWKKNKDGRVKEETDFGVMVKRNSSEVVMGKC